MSKGMANFVEVGNALMAIRDEFKGSFHRPGIRTLRTIASDADASSAHCGRRPILRLLAVRPHATDKEYSKGY